MTYPMASVWNPRSVKDISDSENSISKDTPKARRSKPVQELADGAEEFDLWQCRFKISSVL